MSVLRKDRAVLSELLVARAQSMIMGLSMLPTPNTEPDACIGLETGFVEDSLEMTKGRRGNGGAPGVDLKVFLHSFGGETAIARRICSLCDLDDLRTVASPPSSTFGTIAPGEDACRINLSLIRMRWGGAYFWYRAHS